MVLVFNYTRMRPTSNQNIFVLAHWMERTDGSSGWSIAQARELTWRDSGALRRAARVHEQRLLHRSRYTVSMGPQTCAATATLIVYETSIALYSQHRLERDRAADVTRLSTLWQDAQAERILSTLKLTSAIIILVSCLLLKTLEVSLKRILWCASLLNDELVLMRARRQWILKTNWWTSTLGDCSLLVTRTMAFEN